MALGTTYFIATAFICVLRLFRTRLSALIPIINQGLYISSEIRLPKAGEVLHLSEYSLSERQRMILYEATAKNRTYGEIAQKHDMTTSLVKKEMGSILNYFGSRNIESLKIVFGQFEISEL